MFDEHTVEYTVMQLWSDVCGHMHVLCSGPKYGKGYITNKIKSETSPNSYYYSRIRSQFKKKSQTT